MQAEGEDSLKKMQLMELAILNGTYRDANIKSRKNEPGKGCTCLSTSPFPWSNDNIYNTTKSPIFFLNASVNDGLLNFILYQHIRFGIYSSGEGVQKVSCCVNYPVKTLNLLYYAKDKIFKVFLKELILSV